MQNYCHMICILLCLMCFFFCCFCSSSADYLWCDVRLCFKYNSKGAKKIRSFQENRFWVFICSAQTCIYFNGQSSLLTNFRSLWEKRSQETPIKTSILLHLNHIYISHFKSILPAKSTKSAPTTRYTQLRWSWKKKWNNHKYAIIR